MPTLIKKDLSRSWFIFFYFSSSIGPCVCLHHLCRSIFQTPWCMAYMHGEIYVWWWGRGLRQHPGDFRNSCISQNDSLRVPRWENHEQLITQNAYPKSYYCVIRTEWLLTSDYLHSVLLVSWLWRNVIL